MYRRMGTLDRLQAMIVLPEPEKSIIKMTGKNLLHSHDGLHLVLKGVLKRYTDPGLDDTIRHRDAEN